MVIERIDLRCGRDDDNDGVKQGLERISSSVRTIFPSEPLNKIPNSSLTCGISRTTAQ